MIRLGFQTFVPSSNPDLPELKIDQTAGNIYKNLNHHKAGEPDVLPAHVLKDCSNILSDPLCVIHKRKNPKYLEKVSHIIHL